MRVLALAPRLEQVVRPDFALEWLALPQQGV